MVCHILPQTIDERALREPILCHLVHHAHINLCILLGLGSHYAFRHDYLRLLKDALHYLLPCRWLLGVISLLLFFFLILFCAIFVPALILVCILVIHSIVEILVIELFVGPVKFSDSDAEAEHDVFVFHHRRTNLGQTVLLVYIRLSRVKWTEDDWSSAAVFEETTGGVCTNWVLRELCVQIVGFTVFMLLKLLLLKDICELLTDQVFLLLIKDIDTLLNIIEPGMVEDLFRCQALWNILLKHVLHQITSELGYSVTILDLLLVKLMR